MVGLRVGHGESAGLVSGCPRVLRWAVGGITGQVSSGGQIWAVEGLGELMRPRANGVDSDLGSALAVDEPGGDVQQPVAQQFGLGLGQVAVQEGGLGPSDQVGRGQRELQPGLVDLELSDGNRPIPVCFRFLMRSSTRAWPRCRASSQASWPGGVSVARHW